MSFDFQPEPAILNLAKHVIQVYAVDAAGRRVVARAFQRNQFLAWCTQRKRPGVAS